MKRPWIEKRTSYIAIHSKRNHAEFVAGKGSKHGFLVGINWYDDYDWWHLSLGLTFLFWYIGLNFRWRVFGCQYKRWDKEDYYI